MRARWIRSQSAAKIDSTRQSYSVKHVTLILTRAQAETDDEIFCAY